MTNGIIGCVKDIILGGQPNGQPKDISNVTVCSDEPFVNND